MTSNASAVHAFYFAYYGRPADPAGLAFWAQQLVDADGDFSQVVQAFADAPEAVVRFGATDPATHIARIYEELFDRAPDRAGLEFWAGAIAQGRMSLADAALGILRGAQGADAALAQLRQGALESFTAEVAASGVDYTGYAAIDAARVLAKAVTPAASGADIAAMVKATARLADVAHDRPQVVAALAAGASLAGLFDTARGQAEPVALVQVLAAVAGLAEEGGPAALAALLRGGGIASMLKAIPAGTSLADVARALAEGGLAGAIGVVYPPAPEPTPTPGGHHVGFAAIAFDTSGTDTNLHKDAGVVLTRVADFTVSGTEPGAMIDYLVRDGDAAAWTSTKPMLDEGLNVFSVRQTDAAGNVAVREVKVKLDLTAPGATIEAATIGQAAGTSASVEGSNAALATNLRFATVEATLSASLAADEKVQYSLDGGASWSSQGVSVQATTVTIAGIATSGNPTLLLRVLDAAGNGGAQASRGIVYDNVAAAVRLELDDGSSGSDIVTTDGSYSLADALEPGARAEYSLTGFDGDWSADKPVAQPGLNTIHVRQLDAAGNVSAATSLSFTLRIPVELSFAGVQDGAGKGAVTGLSRDDVVFAYTGELAQDDQVWAKLGDGAGVRLGVIDTAARTITLHDVDVAADPLIQVQAIDGAGYASNVARISIDGADGAPLTTRATPDGLLVTSQVAGQLFAQDKNGNETGLQIVGGGGSIGAGQTVLVGAQVSTTFPGTVLVRTADGVVRDGGGRMYGFDTDRGVGYSHATPNTTYFGFKGDDWIAGSAQVETMYGGEGNNTLTGGAGADRLDVSQGSNTLRYLDADTMASGIDVVAFAPNAGDNPLAQRFDFASVPLALYQANGVANPADLSESALLAALNAVYRDEAGDAGAAAIVVHFLNGDSYLAADTGDGVLDTADYVVKLVGAIPNASLDGTAVVFGPGA